MLLSTILLTIALTLAEAELDCPGGVGQPCSPSCPCPSALRCRADPASGESQTYCMISSDLTPGAYCQNHFGLCAEGLVCDLADPTAPFKTCITPRTTTTTTTTTSTTTTSTTTTTISTASAQTTTIISTTTTIYTSSNTTSGVNTTDSPCYTVSGAMVQAACVFPFTFQGVTYSTCTTAGGFSRPWCSTATDTNTNHLKGYWGDCDGNCPTSDTNTSDSSCQTPCKFPFVYRGVVHQACTFAGGFSSAWCSTRTDPFSHQHLRGSWENCGVGCPVEIVG